MTNHNIKPEHLRKSIAQMKLKWEIELRELAHELRSQSRGTIAANDDGREIQWCRK